MVFLLILVTFKPILDDFLRFWKNPEIQDGRHPDVYYAFMTHLLRHMMSSPHDSEIKGDNCRLNLYPPSLVVIAFIFSELHRWGEIALRSMVQSLSVLS